MSNIYYNADHWRLTKQDLEPWFQKTLITCTLSTDTTKVLKFHRPDTSLFRIDLLLYHTEDDNRIIVAGDAGDLVVRPTWNPLLAANYDDMSYGYFLKKITCADKPLVTYDTDAINLDTEQFIADLDGNNGHDYNNAVTNLARFLATRKSEDVSPDNLDAFMQFAEKGHAAAASVDHDYETINQIINLGLRPSQQVQLVLTALRLCEQYDAFTLPPDDLAIAL